MFFSSDKSSLNTSLFSGERPTISDFLVKIHHELLKGLKHVSVQSTDLNKIKNLFKNANGVEESLRSILISAKSLVHEVTSKKKSKPSLTIINDFSTPSSVLKEDDKESSYQSLEKVLQKYEAEIREHIRKQQQLEIYSDLLEEEIEGLKKKLKNSSKAKKAGHKLAMNQSKVSFFQKKTKAHKEQNKENNCSAYINRIRLNSAERVSL